jgi:hypothetical protein
MPQFILLRKSEVRNVEAVGLREVKLADHVLISCSEFDMTAMCTCDSGIVSAIFLY